jgi:hypothetical protein
VPTDHPGLRVWASKNGPGLWSPEYNEIDRPSDWDFLPTGDSAVTRIVTRGPHWIAMEKKGKSFNFASVRIGIYAPKVAIAEAVETSGGAAGKTVRKERAKEVAGKKETERDNLFRSKVFELFPSFPEADLSGLISLARSEGRVGRSADWYFAKKEDRGSVLESIVELAVRAHARHQYTDYDERLENAKFVDSPSEPRELTDEEYREIKNEAMSESSAIVEGWRKPKMTN